MADRVRQSPPSFHRHRAVSPYVRIAQEWGCNEKTARDTLGPIVRKVATALDILVQSGRTDYAGELLDVIEAPFYGGALSLTDVLHRSALADAAEDTAEAHYRHNPCQATALDLLKKGASDIVEAERRQRELRREWGL